MRKIKEPHWIKHSHLFDPDEYECSACGVVYRRSFASCPNCGATLWIVYDTQEWIDEEDEMNWLLEDDDQDMLAVQDEIIHRGEYVTFTC